VQFVRSWHTVHYLHWR